MHLEDRTAHKLDIYSVSIDIVLELTMLSKIATPLVHRRSDSDDF